MLLVDQPGLCPDCSPSPAAVITLYGASAFPQEGEARPVRVIGRLDYGFRIDAGTASMLRIEGAAVFPAEPVGGELRVKQLIHGGRVLTAGRLDGAHADLLIDGDTIAAVLPPGESVSADAKRVDATNSLLIPGLVNSHTHATVRSARRWRTAGRSNSC